MTDKRLCPSCGLVDTEDNLCVQCFSPTDEQASSEVERMFKHCVDLSLVGLALNPLDAVNQIPDISSEMRREVHQYWWDRRSEYPWSCPKPIPLM